MKALIIADGEENRLCEDEPKSLTQLVGLSLIERTLLTAKEAGIAEFVIVTGFGGDEIKTHLGNGNRYGVRIRYIENGELTDGDGLSVLKAKELQNENFVLLRPDHIVDDRILKKLVGHNTKNSVVLVVDRREPLPGDTRVLEKGGKIVDIGENIQDANCVSTGIFLCTPEVSPYVEEATKGGNQKLVGFVVEAAKNRDAEVLDITQIGSYASKMRKENKSWWIDSDTEKDSIKAEEYLTKSAKSTKGTSIFDKNVIFRKYKLFGDRIREEAATLILKLPISITPNQITIVSFMLGILSAMSFALSYLLVGATLYYVSDVLDGADGIVARRKGKVTSYGAYLDSCLDRYVDTLVLLGICIYLSEIRYIWVIGVLAIIGGFMHSYTTHRAEALGKVVLPSFISWHRRKRMHIIVVGTLLSLFYTPSLFYVLIILALIGNLKIFSRMMPWILKDFYSVDERTKKFLPKTSVEKFQEDENVIQRE